LVRCFDHFVDGFRTYFHTCAYCLVNIDPVC
jgi:hypothetical protein